ncbi:ABC transporter substrate-binding protein [Gudongella oleilytica]|uniref:ABC transporter substrate-binding protein n=1 Tax=Gudongella oleilytica TaxID=1582259 RepID=UPI002A359C55|nr:ABC transporter substrate-binding protein [Gudongella oleilytica]MDY0257262.1 ABC transporter substrate-binding protein [Gudongella oleilytica]
MKRFLSLMLVLLLSVGLITGCAAPSTPPPAPEEPPVSEGPDAPEPVEEPAERINIRFAFMEGVTALTAGKMIKEDTQVDSAFQIQYDLLRSTDLLTSSIMNGEADIAMIPSTLAASAYNKNLGYTVAGTSTWGNLYLIGTEDAPFLGALVGREITTFGKGLTPDLIFRMLLLKDAIEPDSDLTLNYLATAAEVGPYLLSGKATFAILPEPAVSGVIAKSEGKVKILFDLNSLWAEYMQVEKGYPQASLVIKTSLIEEHPEFVESFLAAYEESIQWAMENPGELGSVSEELELGLAKEAVVSGIKRMNIGSFPIEDSKAEYEAYYRAIMDFAPDFIGGKLPDEGLYYR